MHCPQAHKTSRIIHSNIPKVKISHFSNVSTILEKIPIDHKKQTNLKEYTTCLELRTNGAVDEMYANTNVYRPMSNMINTQQIYR